MPVILFLLNLSQYFLLSVERIL